MNKILRLLIYSLVLVLPFGQLTRLPLIRPDLRIYLHDLIIFSIILLWGIKKLKLNKTVKLPPLLKPVKLFIMTALLSLILALPRYQGRELLISSLYLLRWTLYAGLYLVFTDKKIILKLKYPLSSLILASGVILAVFGLLQYFLIPDTRFLSALNWDDHYYRLIATLFDPAFTGLIYVLTLILLVFLKPLKWFYPLFILVFSALMLTYSRSSYLGLLAAVLVFALIKKKIKVLLIMLALFVITIPLLPRPGGEGVKLERLYSITQRVDNSQTALTIIKDYPLLGVGFNTLRYEQRDRQLTGKGWLTSNAAAGLDNSFLFILATTGIIGFIFYLNLLFKIWQLSALSKVALTAIIVHSFFNNSLFYPWIMIWLWLTASLKIKEYS